MLNQIINDEQDCNSNIKVKGIALKLQNPFHD